MRKLDGFADRDRERNIQKLTQNQDSGEEKQQQRVRVYCC